MEIPGVGEVVFFCKKVLEISLVFSEYAGFYLRKTFQFSSICDIF